MMTLREHAKGVHTYVVGRGQDQRHDTCGVMDITKEFISISTVSDCSIYQNVNTVIQDTHPKPI